MDQFRSLKLGNEKCGNEEVFGLVKDLIDSDIIKQDFDNLLEISTKNQSVKMNKFGNRECLALPKESLQHDQEMIEQSRGIHRI